MVVISKNSKNSSVAQCAFSHGIVCSNDPIKDIGPTGLVLVRSMKGKGKKPMFNNTPGTSL